ncbi:MAG: hypothetical protein HY619_08075 [Thaumarchaeota archaeon]|nr:hypothetical protein [Nitrososphaerota archaeon]
MHFHFEKLLINRLMPLQFDPESLTPNYKAVTVRIEKLDTVETRLRQTPLS